MCSPHPSEWAQPAVDDEPAWLRQHADVLFDADGEGRLTRVNEPDPETDAPRVFLARGRTSSLVRVRADVPPSVVERLLRLAEDLPPWDGNRPDPVTFRGLCDALRATSDDSHEVHGPAFRFAQALADTPDGVILIDESSASLLDRHFPYTRSVLPWRSPVVGMVRDGAVVSACYSSRRRPSACEAGVDTVEGYRGRGFAAKVVQGWARAVREAGMTPLYSTSWDNTASLRVAAKLRLVAYADTFSLM